MEELKELVQHSAHFIRYSRFKWLLRGVKRLRMELWA